MLHIGAFFMIHLNKLSKYDNVLLTNNLNCDKKEEEKKNVVMIMKKIKVLFCTLILFCTFFTSCLIVYAKTNTQQDSFASLQGKTAGVLTGTPQDQIVQSSIKDVKLQYYNTVNDLQMALEKNKIDFIALSSVNYYSMAKDYPQFAYVKKPLTTFDVGTIFPKSEKGDALRKQYNQYLSKIKNNGTLDDFDQYWLYPHNWKNIEIPKSGKNGTLTLGTPNTLKPFSFMLNDQNAGFDIAIVAGFCKAYGYGLKIENGDFAGALSGIATGKYDFAAGQISWTQERAESVNYSDFYYKQKIVAIVNTDYFKGSANLICDDQNISKKNQSLWTSIHKSLWEQNRYQTILKGLLVTLEITFFGFLLANILGAFLCWMALSKSKLLSRIAFLYSSLMQGLPIVVVLMLLYYVVFAHSTMNNVTVAILGFGFVFAAFLAQIFESGIRSVNRGQWDAALAMGLSKRQVFHGIVFPQALRASLTAYFSNLINLMKSTAIVGYIAITDLTKVGDIIRSNTYEAFVPLMSVAILYLLMACLLLALMKFIQKKLEPKRIGGKKHDSN